MTTTQIPRAQPGMVCPLLRKDVSKVCHTCPLWVKVRGVDPNTGQEVDDWRCSFAWLPMLLIENASQSRQAGAAVESMRNEIVRRMDNPVPIAKMLEQPR